MNRAFAPCLAIFAAALAFRIPDLADRPMHADEAVLADKFGGLLETGSFPYDPQDYHGPALAWLTLAPARLAGAHRYADLTETTLRIVPALCGVLLVLMPLLLWDGLGRWGAVAAAGLTAISPAMVYYSRYYIPEMLLTTLTGAVDRLRVPLRTLRQGRLGNRGGRLRRAHVHHQGDCGNRGCVHAAGAGLRPSAASHRVTWPVVAAVAIAILIPVATLGFTDGWRALMSYWQRGIHGSDAPPRVGLLPGFARSERGRNCRGGSGIVGATRRSRGAAEVSGRVCVRHDGGVLADSVQNAVVRAGAARRDDSSGRRRSRRIGGMVAANCTGGHRISARRGGRLSGVEGILSPVFRPAESVCLRAHGPGCLRHTGSSLEGPRGAACRYRSSAAGTSGRFRGICGRSRTWNGGGVWDRAIGPPM